MGGECYRYCKLKPGVSITEKEEKLYQELLLRLIPEIKSWFEKQDPNEWVAIFDGGCSLQVKDKVCFEREIILPKELNYSLNIGWQHRRYGSLYDPKTEIASKIMDLLIKSQLRPYIQEDEVDNIASDLGIGMDDCYDDDYRIYQSKGGCHRSDHDLSWSPTGLYGGYDDWETYRDAN